jgi:hypothetical protein
MTTPKRAGGHQPTLRLIQDHTDTPDKILSKYRHQKLLEHITRDAGDLAGGKVFSHFAVNCRLLLCLE